MKKNDYKLTFEDSGQWTSGNFTTWGRIRSTEPLDEKTNSLPELSNNMKAAASEQQRPSSLVATFVERQSDYDYLELYMGKLHLYSALYVYKLKNKPGVNLDIAYNFKKLTNLYISHMGVEKK